MEVLKCCAINRKSEIQHGGRQTGSTYISAPGLGTDKIPNGKFYWGRQHNRILIYIQYLMHLAEIQ